MARMPVLFVSHGSPMHGLAPGKAAAAWRAAAERLHAEIVGGALAMVAYLFA